MSAPYPAHLASDVALRDGQTIRIRPARSDDRARVEDYLIGLSPETRHMRFWSAAVDVSEVASRAVDVDYRDHVTLLALIGGDHGAVVAGAQYIKTSEGRAEVSVSVADAMQGHGLGTLLLGQIAQAAAENAIAVLEASILPENHRMIEMVRRSGFTPRIRALPGSLDVEFPTTLTEDAVALFEEREDLSARRAMQTFLAPDAVAVIGASRDAESIGGRLFRNLLLTGFHGAVYPVNPNAEVVQGVLAYRSVRDVPGPVEVAFIAVPAAHVASVARECGEKGVHGLVVISAGFAEIGEDGPARQGELLAICRDAGMRLIGPNCMGVVNTDPLVKLNGTFATTWPLPGRVGFSSQSGAIGLAVMEHASSLGLGLSSFVSIGNRADISGNDLLSYWETDPGTDVILLYLESFGNPRRFGRLARRIARTKPIVAVKSGRSAAGARAVSSHTGAILAASDAAVDALFSQNGVIRTDTLEQMFDVAALLTSQPLPRGRRVGIVTNAGGLGILCADAAEAHGLQIPAFSDETVSRLRQHLPPEAAAGNPVDMIASATGEDYGRAIRTVAAGGEVDAIIVLYIPPLQAQAPDVARHVVDAIRDIGGRVPVLTSFMSAKGVPAELRAADVQVPSFAFPEGAAIALARVAQLGTWRQRPEGRVLRPGGTRPDEAASILATALERGGGWLEPEEAEALLACYGVPVARSERAPTPEEAASAAGRIGPPVAVKVVGPVHKMDVGGIRLDLRDPGQVRTAAAEMADAVRAAGEEVQGFLVQEMIEGGVEILVGVANDRVFGPVIACGGGGATVELLRDVAIRVAPITDLDAEEMIRSLATFPLLDGYRGGPKADIEALKDALLRVGALAFAHPEIAEMDCNPVMVTPDSALVVDTRVRVEASPPSEPLGAVS